MSVDEIVRALMFDPTSQSQASLSGAPNPLARGLMANPGTFGSGSPNVNAGMLGYDVRKDLYPGEDTFFKGNPHVGGMAAETGDVILNPYSPPTVNQDAVAKNEALRLLMRDSNVTPDFALTEQQKAPFVGSPYEHDEPALKSSIAARIYSGDPSAQANPSQTQWLDQFLNSRFLKR
jgi:hypothetical protein